jgi:hypothetical protein
MKHTFPKLPIVKSGPGPVWVRRLSAKYGDDIARDILAAVRRVRANATDAQVAQAVASLDVGEVLEATRIGALAPAIGAAVGSRVRDILAEGGALGAKDAGAKVVLDLGRVQVERWIDTHGAELVAGLDKTNRAAVREVVKRGWAAGKLPREIAAELRSIIGLTEQQAGAVASRRAALIDGGASEARASQIVARQADRALKQRARNIARNETMTALNRGRQSLWEQLEDTGALPKGQMKEWLTSDDERVCPICGPLDGQQVGIREEFDSDVGALLSPPAHASCRCTVVLV